MKQEMKNILIVGAGGIGSQLTDLLVPALTAGALAERLGGVRVHLMDSDRVEEANLSHQRHEPRMVGRLKVESLAERLEPFLSPALGIVAHGEDLRRAEQLEGYDLVVVAVDRPEPRLLAHAHANEWVDLRCGGDGYVALNDETEPRLVTRMTPDDQQPASCQQEGAIDEGNIEMGYALAAAHGAQSVIQCLRRMLGEPSHEPPTRMYYLSMGEMKISGQPLVEVDDNAGQNILPDNHMKPWTRELVRQLIREAREGRTIPEIAETFRRTEGAIQQQLLKRIDWSQMVYRQDVEVPVVEEEEEEEE